MALETATYISDLVATNPPASDPLAQASNHLQLIKSTLKATFPNIKGAVTATQENLNNGTPVGLIAMWSGTTLPSGWGLCNGGTYNRMDGSGTIVTPDLRDRFIVGSGLSYAEGNTGGVGANVLSVAQLPSHSHTATTDSQGSHVHGVDDPSHQHPYSGSVANAQFPYSAGGGTPGVGTPFTAGSGTAPAYTGISIAANGAHVHNVTVSSTGSGAAVENRPPYYALAFIMKV